MQYKSNGAALLTPSSASTNPAAAALMHIERLLEGKISVPNECESGHEGWRNIHSQNLLEFEQNAVPACKDIKPTKLPLKQQTQ